MLERNNKNSNQKVQTSTPLLHQFDLCLFCLIFVAKAIQAQNATAAASELETMPTTRSAIVVPAEPDVTRAELLQARVEIDSLNQYFRYASALPFFPSSYTFSTEKSSNLEN